MTVPYTKEIAAAVSCLGEDGTDRASGEGGEGAPRALERFRAAPITR
jgi:hypothetical protein